jgi:uncharacterized surface protein with fasciclin (FAS1) repeats
MARLLAVAFTALLAVFAGVQGRELLQAAAPAPGPASVAEAVIGSPDLSTLLAAVQAAGLTSALSDPNLVATVFAPTNEAFAELFTELNITAEEALALPYLGAILQYHVVPGVAATSDMLMANMELPTLLGEYLTVGLFPEAVTIYGIDSSANVTMANIRAGMSVVHVIDGVLLPDLANITAYAAPAPMASLAMT